MAPFIVNPKSIRAFESASAFERWLAKNHSSEAEVFLRIYKKGSATPTVTHAEAIDIALCWGWIDAIRKTYDAESFLQRFTPRKPTSKWSEINRGHVKRLIDAGRMTAHGMKHVDAAKADGRWAAAYAPASQMEVPADLMKAIRAEPKALRTFEGLNRQNLFSLAYRTNTLKTAAGREKRIQAFVEMLKRGETLYPNGAATKKKAAANPKPKPSPSPRKSKARAAKP